MNKYEKLAEPGKMINNIFANIGAGTEAGKNLKRCSVLKEGNTHYSDSSKPLDKLFDDMDNAKDKFFKDIDKALPKEVTYVSRLEQEITQLKDIVKGYRFENTTLKEENFSLKTELESADDILTMQRKEIEISRLPLNERLEQEYINKRENEDKQKKEKK